MFQRDYFMRMIEAVGEAVGQIMGLRSRKEHIEALKAIDDLFDRHLRLQSRLVRSLSDKDLVELLTTNGVVDTVSLEAAALLLKEAGDIHEEQGLEAECFASRTKSLSLYMRLASLEAEPIWGDPKTTVESLLEKLRPYELPTRVKRLLMEWREAEGRIAEAENLLHELLEDGEAELAEAEDFYRRQLLLPNERLLEGGLTREEIEQGLSELHK